MADKRSQHTARDEHNATALAKRSLLVGWNGTDYQVVNLDSSGNLQTSVIVDTPEFFEDTSFVTGDSPVTLDINAALGRNSTRCSVTNDGLGTFTVAVSNDGDAFGDAITLKVDEVLNLDGISVDSIKITWSADSAYRVTAI